MNKIQRKRKYCTRTKSTDLKKVCCRKHCLLHTFGAVVIPVKVIYNAGYMVQGFRQVVESKKADTNSVKAATPNILN